MADASADLQVELEQETDGRWLAEVPASPGVLAYGATPELAEIAVLRLLLQVERDARASNAVPCVRCTDRGIQVPSELYAEVPGEYRGKPLCSDCFLAMKGRSS